MSTLPDQFSKHLSQLSYLETVKINKTECHFENRRYNYELNV